MFVKYRTTPQEHEFGHPFQLGSQASADRPEDCMFASIKIAAGDVIVMGSDGLWDNLFDRQVRPDHAIPSQLGFPSHGGSQTIWQLVNKAWRCIDWI